MILNTSAAEAALELLRDDAPTGDRQRRWAALLHTPAYRAWARCCGVSPDALVDLGAHPPVSGAVAPPKAPRAVRGLFEAFGEGRDRWTDLSSRLVQARRLPVTTAARRAAAVLPGEATLDAEVFVLLAGDRQGMTNDVGQVTIDLLSVPPCPADELMCRLLAHELHHIGLRQWVERDPAFQAAVSAGGPRDAAVMTVYMLLQEGTANTYFTPSDTTWMRRFEPELAGMGVDEAALEAFEGAVHDGRGKIPCLVRELGEALGGMLSVPPEPAALAYAERLTEHRAGLPRPVAHFLGEAMVETIRHHAGHAAVVETIRDWRGFLPAYQTAAAKLGLPRLQEETVERLREQLTS